jgi:hypothetical protein
MSPPLGVLVMYLKLLRDETALFVALNEVDVEVLNEATELLIEVKSVEPPPLPTNVLNESSALFVLLKPVDVDVLNDATELLMTPNEPPKTLLKAVDVDVLNEATLLST